MKSGMYRSPVLSEILIDHINHTRVPIKILCGVIVCFIVRTITVNKFNSKSTFMVLNLHQKTEPRAQHNKNIIQYL